MEPKLLLVACNSMIPEISHVVNASKYPDVALRSFPDTCFGNTLTNERIFEIIGSDSNKYSKIIFFVGSCRSVKFDDNFKGFNIEIIRLGQCFEIFFNPDTVYHFFSSGYYVVTNGWLKNYKEHLKQWGFEDKTARIFFGESIKKILHLDTGIPGNFEEKLQQFCNYSGCAAERIPIGTDYLKFYLGSLIQSWRNSLDRKLLNDKIIELHRQTADYLMVFNELKELIVYTEENLIIQQLKKLLNLLFAPEAINFFTDSEDHESIQKTNLNNNSLLLEIRHQQKTYIVFEIINIRFPEYIGQYKQMQNVISMIGGLALSNARKYTELEKMKDELKQSGEELRQINATKDKFFSIIAHDLKSPFNSLVGLSELLVEEYDVLSDKEKKQYSGVIYKSASQTLQLIENLLEWATMQNNTIVFKPARLHLAEHVEEVISYNQQMALQKEIKVQHAIPENIKVFADENMLKTILRNLVSNAIKYTMPGGEIIVSAILENEKAIVKVKDSGVGISADNLSQLFEIGSGMSTRGTSNEKGTGLGLILCKEFIEKQKGRIWVESAVGEGSSFYFSLPAGM